VFLCDQGHSRRAGEDIGALRSAVAMVFERFGVMFDDRRECFVFVPNVRGEMTVPGWTGGENPLRRVSILYDVNNQHGTFVWKYMTQNTRRPL
jgi:hypothetical protein